MASKPKDLISRGFKRDFPEFVARAEALGVRITTRRSTRGNRLSVYWAEGEYQLTGYETRKDGGRFTHDDVVRHIDEVLSSIEEDRRKIETMSEQDRFARVMDDFRQMTPQDGMLGVCRYPSGDGGGIFFMARYSGSIHLHGIGTIARAEVEWSKDIRSKDRLTLLCDRLEQDYASRCAERNAEAENA